MRGKMRMMENILLIDKPIGPTSHDIVSRVRRALGTRRVGHAGTLDPFASGLLILGVEKGTKQLADFVGLDKIYEATIRLGAVSDTYDPEGIVRLTHDSNQSIPNLEKIEGTLQHFRGGYLQRAPMYSAKKVGGKKLYDLARKTGTLHDDLRPSKEVKIFELAILKYAWPFLSIRVRCSSGTYIRSLADDIGRDLGVGGYLIALRRMRIGEYAVENAVKITDLGPVSKDTF